MQQILTRIHAQRQARLTHSQNENGVDSMCQTKAAMVFGILNISNDEQSVNVYGSRCQSVKTFVKLTVQNGTEQKNSQKSTFYFKIHLKLFTLKKAKINYMMNKINEIT